MCLVWWPTDSHKTLLFTMLLSNHFWRKAKMTNIYKQSQIISSFFFFLIRPRASQIRWSRRRWLPTLNKKKWLETMRTCEHGCSSPTATKPVRGWLWERADKRGRKIRPASILLIWSCNYTKKSTHAVWAGSACCSQGEAVSYSRCCGNNLSSFFFLFFFFSPHNRLMCVL